MLSPASNLLVICCGDRLDRAFLGWRGGGFYAYADSFAKLFGKLFIQLAGVASGFCFYFTGQQGGDYAVLAGGPCAAVHSYKAGSCAFFAGKSQVAIKQAWGEPFETDGHIV